MRFIQRIFFTIVVLAFPSSVNADGRSFSLFSVDNRGKMMGVRVSLHSHSGHEFFQIGYGVPPTDGGLYPMNIIYFVDCVEKVEISADTESGDNILTVVQSRLFVCAAHFDDDEKDIENKAETEFSVKLGARTPSIDILAQKIEEMIGVEVEIHSK